MRIALYMGHHGFLITCWFALLLPLSTTGIQGQTSAISRVMPHSLRSLGVQGTQFSPTERKIQAAHRDGWNVGWAAARRDVLSAQGSSPLGVAACSKALCTLRSEPETHAWIRGYSAGWEAASGAHAVSVPDGFANTPNRYSLPDTPVPQEAERSLQLPSRDPPSVEGTAAEIPQRLLAPSRKNIGEEESSDVEPPSSGIEAIDPPPGLLPSTPPATTDDAGSTIEPNPADGSEERTSMEPLPLPPHDPGIGSESLSENSSQVHRLSPPRLQLREDPTGERESHSLEQLPPEAAKAGPETLELGESIPTITLEAPPADVVAENTHDESSPNSGSLQDNGEASAQGETIAEQEPLDESPARPRRSRFAWRPRLLPRLDPAPFARPDRLYLSVTDHEATHHDEATSVAQPQDWVWRSEAARPIERPSQHESAGIAAQGTSPTGLALQPETPGVEKSRFKVGPSKPRVREGLFGLRSASSKKLPPSARESPIPSPLFAPPGSPMPFGD